MSEEIEYEEVTVKLPKSVVNYIREMEGDVAKHISYCIVDLTTSHVEQVNAEYLIDKFNLEPAFKAYNVLPVFLRDP